MELVRKRGSPLRFPFELFREQERSYDRLADSGARWQSIEYLGARRLLCIEPVHLEGQYLAASTELLPKIVGVGVWRALRRGVWRRRVVLPPRWDCGRLARTYAKATETAVLWRRTRLCPWDPFWSELIFPYEKCVLHVRRIGFRVYIGRACL